MGAKKTVEELVEGLAIAVNEGFNDVQKQFKGVNEKFKNIDEQFKGVNEQFKGVDKRFDSMQTQMDKRFDSMQNQMDKRFDEAYEHVENRIDSLAIAVNDGFNGVSQEIGELKDELTSVKFQSSNLDPRVSVLEKKVNIIGLKLGLQS